MSEMTVADTMLLWKMYQTSKRTLPMSLPSVQNYNIAVTICYWIQASSLFLNGVNTFKMFSLPCFKFILFLTLLPNYFYWIQLYDSLARTKISVQNNHSYLWLPFIECYMNKTVKCSFYKKTLLICQEISQKCHGI